MNIENIGMVRPDDWLARGFELCHRGDVAEADELAEEAVSRFPEDGQLWQLRGLLRQRMGDWEGARSALETANSLVPLKVASRCALADCYARSGKVELARDLYRALIEPDCCPRELLPAVAAGLGGLGDDEHALLACRELSRRNPERPEGFFGVAFYLRRLGHPASAVLPLVRRAHELSQDVPLYRITLASLLANSGRREEAYDLLCDVDLADVGCRCCLRRMMNLFGSAGDVARAATCRDRVDRLESRRGHGGASRP